MLGADVGDFVGDTVGLGGVGALDGAAVGEAVGFGVGALDVAAVGEAV